MKRNAENAVRGPLCALVTIAAVLAMLSAARVNAQEQNADRKTPETYQTLYITSLTEPREMNDLVTDLRNMLPMAKIYRVESANAISMRASADDFAMAQKIVADIDRPRKTYRLTYTISDGGSQSPAQRFVMIVGPGNRTTLKQGTRVPIMTGTYKDGAASSPAVQYMDVGLNLDATLEGRGDEIRLRTKVEQTSVAEEKSNVGIQDPVIHQSVLEGESAIAMGKPAVLGSMEMPGSRKRVEVSVVADAVK